MAHPSRRQIAIAVSAHDLMRRVQLDVPHFRGRTLQDIADTLIAESARALLEDEHTNTHRDNETSLLADR